MRTVIGVLQCEQFIDQGICFPVGHLVISLYRSLTCHGGQSGSKDSKWILILLRSKIVKHFQKKFFLRKTVQIGRDCIDTVFLTAKWFNLKSKILEIFTVSLKKSFFLKIQGYDQRRTEILGFYCLLTKPFYETLIINLFMCRMLVDNKKFILKLNSSVPAYLQHFIKDSVFIIVKFILIHPDGILLPAKPGQLAFCKMSGISFQDPDRFL